MIEYNTLKLIILSKRNNTSNLFIIIIYKNLYNPKLINDILY